MQSIETLTQEFSSEKRDILLLIWIGQLHRKIRFGARSDIPNTGTQRLIWDTIPVPHFRPHV